MSINWADVFKPEHQPQWRWLAGFVRRNVNVVNFELRLFRFRLLSFSKNACSIWAINVLVSAYLLKIPLKRKSLQLDHNVWCGYHEWFRQKIKQFEWNVLQPNNESESIIHVFFFSWKRSLKRSIYAYLSIRWKSEFQYSNISIRFVWLMPKPINEMQTAWKSKRNDAFHNVIDLNAIGWSARAVTMFTTSFTIFVIEINQNVNHLISSNNAICSVCLYARMHGNKD